MTLYYCRYCDIDNKRFESQFFQTVYEHIERDHRDDIREHVESMVWSDY